AAATGRIDVKTTAPTSTAMAAQVRCVMGAPSGSCGETIPAPPCRRISLRAQRSAMALGTGRVVRGAVNLESNFGRSPSLDRRRSVAAAAISCLVLLGCVAALAGPARAECTPPRCLDVAVPVPQGLRVPESTVRILLP